MNHTSATRGHWIVAIGAILVVIAQPALAAVVCTFLAAWNGHPDLGRAPSLQAVTTPHEVVS